MHQHPTSNGNGTSNHPATITIKQQVVHIIQENSSMHQHPTSNSNDINNHSPNTHQPDQHQHQYQQHPTQQQLVASKPQQQQPLLYSREPISSKRTPNRSSIDTSHVIWSYQQHIGNTAVPTRFHFLWCRSDPVIAPSPNGPLLLAPPNQPPMALQTPPKGCWVALPGRVVYLDQGIHSEHVYGIEESLLLLFETASGK